MEQKHRRCIYSNVSTYFNTKLALKRVGLFFADIFQNYLGGRLGLLGSGYFQNWVVDRLFVLMGMGMWPLLINTQDLCSHTRHQGNGVYLIDTKLSQQIKQYRFSEIIKAIESHKLGLDHTCGA